MRSWGAIAGLVAALALSAGCGGSDESTASPLAGASFVVGSEESTEQLILGQLTVVALEAAGASVDDRTGTGSALALRAALAAAEIDVYWQYTGTVWGVLLAPEDADLPADGEALYEAVAAEDLKNGVVWLEATPMGNSYVIATARGYADALGVHTLSQLADLAASRPGEATLCGSSSWFARTDGLAALEAAYEFELPEAALTAVDLDAVYAEVASGDDCNFGVVLSTDARILSNDLVVLEDDLGFFLPNSAAATVRQEVFDRYGDELSDFLNPIAAALDDAQMRELNARVDLDGEDAATVAADFLRAEGLID